MADTQTREFGPQLGRARKDKYLRHGTKVRMRGQLLGDAEMKDARWRLGKACRNIELKRAAEAKRKARAGAQMVGPHLFALAPCYHVVSESDVCGTGKALVLTTSDSHPCHALASFSRAAHEGVAVVLPMQVTDELKLGWIEEASLCAPGPVSKPLLRTIRALGAGAALVALGAESCSLLSKIVQDQLVAENAGVVMLVQPDLGTMKQGALSALAQLNNVELVLSKSVVAQTGTGKLLAVFPKASLRICNDGAVNASGIDLVEVGMCLADAILVSMGCERSSTRRRYEDESDVGADNGGLDAGGDTHTAGAGDREEGGDGELGTDEENGEEELEELGLYEIVMRPQGGGGRGGDSGTRMNVMMLAPEEIWGDEEDLASEGEYEDEEEYEIVEAEAARGEEGLGGEDGDGSNKEAKDEEDAIAISAAGRLKLHDKVEKDEDDMCQRNAVAAAHQQNNKGGDEGEHNGVPAGARVVLKGGGFFVVGGEGGREAAQRRAQEAMEQVGAVGRGGGEAAMQKWTANYPNASSAEKKQKKRVPESKATAQSRSRARERMRGERIGR